MRTYKLMLSPSYSLEFRPTWIAKLRKGDLSPIYRVLSGVAFAALLASAVLFPLLTNWSNPEVGFTTYLITLVTFLIATMLAMLVLVGSKRLSDPPLFMSALIFVFLVLAGLLFAPANANNTFGMAGVKYLGGLWVMILLGLYYVITLFVNSGRKLRIAKLALIGGLVVSVLGLIMANKSSSPLLSVVFLSLPVLTLAAFQSHKVIVSLASGIAALVGLVFGLRLMAGPELMITVLIALVMTGLTLLAVSNWKVQFDVSDFQPQLMQVLTRKLGIRTFVRRNLFVLIAAGGLIWAVLLIVWMLSSHYALGSLFDSILREYISAANALTDIKSIIIGNGVSGATSSTLLANVIRYQGVVGLLAYVLMAVSGFYLVLQSLANEMRLGNRNWWSLGLSIFVFAVPVYAFLGTPSMVLAILWWTVVGLLAAKLLWDEKGIVYHYMQEQLVVRTMVLDKYLPVIQAVAIVVIFVIWVYVLAIVAALATKGVI